MPVKNTSLTFYSAYRLSKAFEKDDSKKVKFTEY